VPDKQQVWDDLLRLINDKNSRVSLWAAFALCSSFSYVPDKQQAWNDLHGLTNDESWNVRSSAADALGSAFSQVPDKQQAWNDLHGLTKDIHNYVRSSAAEALGSAFSQVPDKQQAWDDLRRLINDDDIVVRYHAADALGSAFSYVPDKQQAWDDLRRLINDDIVVRSHATGAIGSSFSYLPDKQQAWEDLHRLINDEDSSVRFSAASALGSAFSYVLDKQQVLEDLRKLTNDDDNVVRTFANHSLGRVSIYKASRAGKYEVYKQELEKAIEFFEKATQESPHEMLNPSQFCLPFYRSFHSIVFIKQEAKEEMDRYLAEAKSAIEGSKSKELLLEAVENLSNALREVKNLGNLDLDAKKGELSFYRKYCDRAAELMVGVEEEAPFAIGTMRKGLPILNRNLKDLLEEIKEKAKTACQVSKGTRIQEIAYAVSQEVQKWEIGSQEEMTWNIEGLIETFRLRMPRLPGYEHIFEEIEGIRDEKDIVKQYKIVSRLIGLIPILNSMPDHVVQDIKDIKNNTIDIKVELDTIGKKLDCIRFDIFKIKLNSSDVFSKLISMKNELEKLNEIVCINAFSIDKLDSTQAERLDNLKNDISERLHEMETLIDRLPNNEDTQGILDRLNKLKQSGLDILLQRSSGIDTLISFIVLLAQLCQQYGPI